MTLLFMDSFDHYVAADLPKKWHFSEVNLPFIGATGRNGTSAMQIYATRPRGVRRNLGVDSGTLVVGFGLSLANALSASFNQSFMTLLDAGTTQISLMLNSAGRLVVMRGDTTATLGTGSTVFAVGAWNWVELKVVFDGTAGTVDLRVNGVSEVSLTGQITRITANNYANQIGFRHASSSSDTPRVEIDDLYVCNSDGAVNNNFLGDCRVECIYPSGNGNSSQMVGSDANSTDNYLLVDEATPNGDTDYVESGTTGEKDTYAFGDLITTLGTVRGVSPLPSWRKSNAGASSGITVARLSATEEDSAAVPLSVSYTLPPVAIRETKPGGGAWSIADVNSAEFGVKVF